MAEFLGGIIKDMTLEYKCNIETFCNLTKSKSWDEKRKGKWSFLILEEGNERLKLIRVETKVINQLWVSEILVNSFINVSFIINIRD